MSTIYSAIAVVNWFIITNKHETRDLTHLKIQKLLYFAQGFFLANYDKPLFEEDIEAWKYGPVVNPVYQALKRYNENNITEPINGFYLSDTKLATGIPKIESNDYLVLTFLIEFWNIYKPIPVWRLVNITHMKDSPWQQIIDTIISGQTTNQVIPKELIKIYFKNIITRAAK
jgi:uncharacterized phage-associated protein